jgi:membrane associated rhomboid family serine protease
VATPEDNIAWWAHVGGLAVGALLVIVLRRPGVPLFDKNLVQVEKP